MKFLDTNIFVRYLTGDDPVKAAACRQLWQQVNRGQEKATTAEAIVRKSATCCPRHGSITSATTKSLHGFVRYWRFQVCSCLRSAA